MYFFKVFNRFHPQTYTPKQPAVFEGLTVWRCAKGAESVNGGAVQFESFVAIQNTDAGIEMKRVLSTAASQQYTPNGAMISGAAIIGRLSESGPCTKRALVLPFDPYLLVRHTVIAMFDCDGSAGLGVTSIVGKCSQDCGGYHYRFANMFFSNVTFKVTFRWEQEGVLEALDDTLTGDATRTVIPKSGCNHDSCRPCQHLDSGGVSAYCCPSDVQVFRFTFYSMSHRGLRAKDSLMANSFGNMSVPFRFKRLTRKNGWMALVVCNETYHVTWVEVDEISVINVTYYGKFSEIPVRHSPVSYLRARSRGIRWQERLVRLTLRTG